MKTLDAFYIRKPWYIILEDALGSNVFNAFYNERYGEPDIKISNSDLIESKDFDDKLLCDEEVKFNKVNEIYFSKEHFIKRKFKAKAAKALERYWFEKIGEMKTRNQIDNRVYLHDAFGIGDDYSIADSKNKFNDFVDSHIRSYTTPSRWKDKIGKKITKVNCLELPVNLGVAVCEIAIIILNEQIKDNKKNNQKYLDKTLELEKVELIREKFIKALREKRDFENVFEKQTAFWKSDKYAIPDWFQNSHWIGYVRNDKGSNYSTNNTEGIKTNNFIKKDIYPNNKTQTESADWAISKSYLYLGKTSAKGYTPIIHRTPFGNTEYSNEGIATFEWQRKYIIGHLKRTFDHETRNSTPSFILFPIQDEDKQDLIIGLYTYFSMYHLRFITKRIILKNTSMEHEPDIIEFNSEEFHTLEDSIKQFLYDRDRNQMLLPFNAVTYLDYDRGHRSLDYLMEKQTSVFKEDTTLKNIIGNYYVCFLDEKASIKPGDDPIDFVYNNIQIDELDIVFEECRLEYVATYRYSQNKRLRTYHGYARKQDTTIQIILHHKKVKDSDPTEIYPLKNAEERIALLNIFLPRFSDVNAKEVLNAYSLFPSLISGLTESQEAIAYRTIVVRRENSSSDNDLLSSLKKFKENDKMRKFVEYFLDQSSPLNIMIPKNFYDVKISFPNIDDFIDRDGQILRSKRKTENGNILYILKLFNKDMSDIPNGEFSGLTEDEVQRNADLWLLEYNKGSK